MSEAMAPFATRVQAELLKEFRLWVLKKHGQLYGQLKYEIGRAFKNHIKTMRSEIEDGNSTEVEVVK